MDLTEIGWGGKDTIDLLRIGTSGGALANTVMNILVLYNVEKFLSSFATCGFSRRARLRGVS
jgi:hypothetical protein